jgi:hypothetical protein
MHNHRNLGLTSCRSPVTVRSLPARAQQAQHERAGVTDVTDSKEGGACPAHDPDIASYRATTSKNLAENEDEWARLPAIRRMLAKTVQPAGRHVKRKREVGKGNRAWLERG